MTAGFVLLDRPEILSVMFYPRRDMTPGPPESVDLRISVDGAELHARFYPNDPAGPVVLFFHGNGEVVADYDDVAPVYHHFGMSLLAADYRGYGQSSGRPAFTTMLADAHAVKTAAFAHLDAAGFGGPRFLMGRSLGALSAVELAATDAEGFAGLVLESGAAGIRGWSRFARPGEDPAPWEELRAAQLARMAAVTLPLLTIHGAEDELIPVQSALDVQAALGSASKRLLVIPHAGHNDLMAVGLRQYFEALAAFVQDVGGSASTSRETGQG